MKKFLSMLFAFGAVLSMLSSSTAFADWGDKSKQAEHEAKANYYEAKDNVKDAADDAGDEIEDFADDVKDDIKDATN